VLAPEASTPAKGTTVAKGHKCPTCGKNTLQPYTTNQLRCSNCHTTVKKDQIQWTASACSRYLSSTRVYWSRLALSGHRARVVPEAAYRL
jgi:ribosomal protein L37AE/L43A